MHCLALVHFHNTRDAKTPSGYFYIRFFSIFGGGQCLKLWVWHTITLVYEFALKSNLWNCTGAFVGAIVVCTGVSSRTWRKILRNAFNSIQFNKLYWSRRLARKEIGYLISSICMYNVKSKQTSSVYMININMDLLSWSNTLFNGICSEFQKFKKKKNPMKFSKSTQTPFSCMTVWWFKPRTDTKWHCQLLVKVSVMVAVCGRQIWGPNMQTQRGGSKLKLCFIAGQTVGRPPRYPNRQLDSIIYDSERH